ncbi:MAG: DUF2784 domain-containing protein [Pirellulaceae bacterium]
MSIYSFLADATVTVHVAYVLFVVMGLFLVVIGGLLKWRWIRNRWFRYTHLTMIGVVVIESLLSITCPLTTLEAYWRSQAGQAVEDSSFMGRLASNVILRSQP